MNRATSSRDISRCLAVLVPALVMFLAGACLLTEPEMPECTMVELTDVTEAAGLEHFSQTFGVAVSDLNNDGRDDLVVSNHGKLAMLFINQGTVFADRSSLLPDRTIADIHGVTAVDLDNDGDRDLVFAGGGADGVGPGSASRLHRNLLQDSGSLDFSDETIPAAIPFRPWRSRHLLPVSSPDGSMVDLFLTCLKRSGHPALYLANRTISELRFNSDASFRLNQPFNTEGKDIFFDFDRDGDPDLLLLEDLHPLLYENVDGEFRPSDVFFPDIHGFYSAATGDLNNDGYPDIYLGAMAGWTWSDRVTVGDDEIHCVMREHEYDVYDRVAFTVAEAWIDIDFIQHTPGETIVDPASIFLGASRRHPTSRRDRIREADALGEPVRDQPGIYIWVDPANHRWVFEWRFSSDRRELKGKVMAAGLHDVSEVDLETEPIEPVEDRIIINRSGQYFAEVAGVDLSHTLMTRSVVICDLNNDGWMEIAGIRGAEPGHENGEPFLLLNCGDFRFTYHEIMSSDVDDIFQADQLVYGFFNSDGLPDLFFTNGFGLNPGFEGPFRLYRNTTDTDAGWVILTLRGVRANRDAIGAQVELLGEGDALLGYREVGAGYNRAQSTLKVHFGLGTTTGELKARIRWPGSTSWQVVPVDMNRNIFVSEES